ncbi:hypothetical protein [Methanobacterium sp.]|uniref:hypothetical protein n=1 Tax=Methanobacterium sp. TaxID=2164 RepID=UPI003C7915BF
MENRPKGILIVSIILFFAAVMALIVAISTFFQGTILDVLWTLNNSFPSGFRSSTVGMIFGIFILILGLVVLSAALGLPKGRKWSWWITVIIFMANGIGDATRLALGSIEGIAGILIAAVFLFYMTRPKIRTFFKFN